MLESGYTTTTYTEYDNNLKDVNLVQENKRESPTPKRAASLDKLRQNGFSQMVINPYCEPHVEGDKGKEIKERRKSFALKQAQEQSVDSLKDRKNSKSSTDFKIAIFTTSEEGLKKTPRKDGT